MSEGCALIGSPIKISGAVGPWGDDVSHWQGWRILDRGKDPSARSAVERFKRRVRRD